MLSYLQKFNSLPSHIKNAVASPEAAARIAALGKQYNLELASVVMKVMAKEVSLEGLGAFLINQFGIAAEISRSLEKDLRKIVFAPVIDFLLSPDATAKLVFDHADEQEVKTNAKNLTSLDYDAQVDEALDRVVTKSHISFADPLVSGKFKQVVKTYLRGTRDKTATLEALSKAAELGGVALSRDAAQRALGVADAELFALKKVSVPTKPKIPVPEDISYAKASESKSENPFKKITSEADYNLESAIAEKIAAKPILEKPKDTPALDLSHEIAPPVPAVVTKKASAPVRAIVKEAISGTPINKDSLRKASKDVPAAKPKPIINFPTSPSGKIRMDDIRYTPQVLSPVDELRYMTVKQFRRLNPDPVKAIEKIKEKLELLGKEDYGKKIEGIVAWHESPLSNLYLSLCRRALEEGKPVTDILRDEAQHDAMSLKNEELSAIIALNRDLKF